MADLVLQHLKLLPSLPAPHDGVQFQIPAAPLLVQLLANAPEKSANSGPNHCALATPVKDPGGIPGFRLPSGSAPAVGSHLGS